MLESHEVEVERDRSGKRHGAGGVLVVRRASRNKCLSLIVRYMEMQLTCLFFQQVSLFLLVDFECIVTLRCVVVLLCCCVVKNLYSLLH